MSFGSWVLSKGFKSGLIEGTTSIKGEHQIVVQGDNLDIRVEDKKGNLIAWLDLTTSRPADRTTVLFPVRMKSKAKKGGIVRVVLNFFILS